MTCPCSSELGDPEHFIAFEEIEALVDHALENQSPVKHVILSGGEPTQHPRFWEVVDYLSRNKLSLGILTNGSGFTEPEASERLRDYFPPGSVHITTALHGNDAKQHDEMTGIPGSFSDTITALCRLHENGIGFTVKYIASKYTLPTLPALSNDLLERFGTGFQMILCQIDYCGRAWTNRERLFVDYKTASPVFGQVVDRFVSHFGNEARRHVRIYDTPFCAINFVYWPFLRQQEGNRLAGFYSPESPNENRRTTGMQSVPQLTGTVFESCGRCGLREKCPGVWKSVQPLFSGDDFRPFILSTTGKTLVQQ